MIKLIASDMDGTLLNSSSQISNETVLSIQLAQQHGITFMIATGRGRKEALPLIRSFGLNLPMITVNGAQVFDENGKVLFTVSIPKELVKKVIPILKKHQLYFELATNHGTYSDSHLNRITNTSYYLSTYRKNISRKLAIALSAAHLEGLNVTFVDDFEDIIQNEDFEILKFIVFGMENSNALLSAKNEIAALPELVVSSSAKNNIEINYKDAQKGLALKKVAELMDLSLDEVMAIGDNFNDVSMLKAAGVSFVMANAPKEIKALGDYLTTTNDDHGVAKAIQRVITEKI